MFRPVCPVLCGLLACCLLAVPLHGQFIHIFEVQDENRAPKSDLFDPSQYKYVSPSQLQKQQDELKLLQAAARQQLPPASEPSITTTTATTTPSVSSTDRTRVTAIAGHSRPRHHHPQHQHHGNAYSSEMAPRHLHQQPRTNHSSAAYRPAPASVNQVPEQYDSEVRKQIRQLQHSENRYSRTTPLRVSAQNQRQYVVRVPAPFLVNLTGGAASTGPMPQQQLPPNLQQLPPPPPTAATLQNQYSPVHFVVPPSNQSTNIRLSTLNTMLSQHQHQHQHLPNDHGIPSSLLNSFLQRTQPPPPTQRRPNASSGVDEIVYVQVPPYAMPPETFASTASPAAPAPPTSPVPQPTATPSAGPTGRSVASGSNALLLQQPPISNKESLTDEDIRLIEEHNRKVRLFLQQRQAELQAVERRAQEQKLAEEARRAQQEAAARAAAEQERIRRLKAEQEAAARVAAEQEQIRRLRAEQEAAARAAAAEQERHRRLKAEQEAAARAAAAEQERMRRIKAEQEAAAAEQERVRRLKAEQEAAARAAAAAEEERLQRLRAEQEQIRRLREEQEAAARAAAAEQERIRRIKAEQEAVARLAAEQERIRKLREQQEALEQQERLRKLREEQEMAARAAAEQERLQRVREEQERYQKAKEAQEEAEQERLRQLRAQQEVAIRLAEAERHRLQRVPELLRYQSPPASSYLPAAINATTTTAAAAGLSSLAYQPEPSLAIDDGASSLVGGGSGAGGSDAHRHHQLLRSQPADAARVRAEKEALAEQERLLRFQASQQALAQQQQAEQDRLRKLREQELLRAEEERLLREAQERQILRARDHQNRLIQTARDAAVAREASRVIYAPYTAEPAAATNNSYTSAGLAPHFASLNNVRTPEPTGRSVGGGSIARAILQDDYPARRTVPAKNETTFKPAKISLQELPPDLDRDGIPGVAGRDYPTLTQIPKTSFSCARQPLNGYYADTETACQVVHMCQMGGVQDSFICPNGTIWNQEKFACQWWYEVNCATAPSFYALNNNLYKGRAGTSDQFEPDSSPSSLSVTFQPLSPSSSSAEEPDTSRQA